MRKVVIFSKTKNWWAEEPDIELLNQQIAEAEQAGWTLVSISANTCIFGCEFNYADRVFDLQLALCWRALLYYCIFRI